MMRNKLAGLLAVSLVPLSLDACGGTGRFVADPQLNVQNSTMSTPDTVDRLFTEDAAPYKVKFCNADKSSKTCKPGSDGLSAFGIGGPIFPLSMNVGQLDLKTVQSKNGALAISSKVGATVDAIPPVCGTVDGTITTKGDAASIQLSNFYCNWAVIGNVLANIKLSIDSIDLPDKTFTGYYRITFYGTGNASGSGYFKGQIVGKPT